MNKPIKLTDTLYEVVVPKDAICWIATGHNSNYYLYYNLNDEEEEYSIKLEGNFELLGEVTADSISFDVEPYVESKNIKESFNDYLTKCFVDYTKVNKYFTDKDESFYSLLQSKEIYFVNPIEKPEKYVPISSNPTEELRIDAQECYKKDFLEWQEAESKLVDKVVIIKKV